MLLINRVHRKSQGRATPRLTTLLAWWSKTRKVLIKCLSNTQMCLRTQGTIRFRRLSQAAGDPNECMMRVYSHSWTMPIKLAQSRVWCSAFWSIRNSHFLLHRQQQDASKEDQVKTKFKATLLSLVPARCLPILHSHLLQMLALELNGSSNSESSRDDLTPNLNSKNTSTENQVPALTKTISHLMNQTLRVLARKATLMVLRLKRVGSLFLLISKLLIQPSTLVLACITHKK